MRFVAAKIETLIFKIHIKMKKENETSTTKAAMPYDAVLCTGLNNVAKQIHTDAKRKGFWDSEREAGTLLMLCVSELAEALEADRKDKFANLARFDEMMARVQDYKRDDFRIDKEILYFKENIKDTFEDELADTVIRILDICGARRIDLEKHINLKLKYNRTRERMHGKNY